MITIDQIWDVIVLVWLISQCSLNVWMLIHINKLNQIIGDTEDDDR